MESGHFPQWDLAIPTPPPPPFLTMTTTTRNYDTTTQAKQSTWSNPDTMPWYLRWEWVRWCICVDADMIRDMVYESEIRDTVRHELTRHRPGNGRKALLMCVDDVYQECGYDLTRKARDAALEDLKEVEERAEANAAAYIELCEHTALAAQHERQHQEAMALARELHNSALEAVGELMGVGHVPIVEAYRPQEGEMLEIEPSNTQEELRQEICRARMNAAGHHAPTPPPRSLPVGREEGEAATKECDHTALVIPRFVAAVVTALRVKFGKLGNNEANRLLIEREYLKVCRETDIRNTDIATHQQWVMNTYFNEGIMEQLATTRVRLPGWLRRAFGEPPNAAPTTC